MIKMKTYIKPGELRGKSTSALTLMLLLGVFLLYNLISPQILGVSLIFYGLLFVWMICSGLTSIFKTARSGIDKTERHSVSRHWGRLLGNGLLAVFGTYLGYLFLIDAVDAHEHPYPIRNFQVTHNSLSLYGHWLLQQPNLKNLDDGTQLKAFYPLRWNLLREKSVYRITYGSRSHLIYQAELISYDPK